MFDAHELFHGKLILAPMTKGSNTPFRLLCRELGADITVGEMALSFKVNKGSRAELALLRSHEQDHPFGAQLAARSPEEVASAAAKAEDMGSDFVDLNCGCPIDHFTRRGLGAELMRKPKRLAQLVRAMRHSVTLPVTVKIRSGWNESKKNYLDIARMVQEEGANAITLHGRTREQRYSKAADWELVRELKETLSIPVIGNGDLLTHWEIKERWERSGCDAVMTARGALIKPWIFREAKEGRTIHLTAEERLDLLKRYVELALIHFRDDERGRRQVRIFLTWHLGFLCRYRQLPEETYRSEEFSHPLLQTRFESTVEGDDLESVMARSDSAAHGYLASLAMGEIDRDAPVPPPDETPAEDVREIANG